VKLTRSTGYALAGLEYITLKGRYQPVPAKNIAQFYEIPLDYLLKVLQQLARTGILLSIRGPQGGYKLTREAREITLREVVEAVEGDLKVEIGQFSKKVEKGFLLRLRQVYQEATVKAAETLEKISLEELIKGNSDEH